MLSKQKLDALMSPTAGIPLPKLNGPREPFDEAVLFRIASAYEAATRHRTPPPDFGPLSGEP
jgi:hypothetical protein